MNVRVNPFLNDALSPPETERVALVDALYASMDGPLEDRAEVDAAWDSEIARRVDEIRAGRAKLTPLHACTMIGVPMIRHIGWLVVVTAVCGCNGSAASKPSRNAGGTANTTSSGGNGVGGLAADTSGTTDPDACRAEEMTLARTIMDHKSCAVGTDCKLAFAGCHFIDTHDGVLVLGPSTWIG